MINKALIAGFLCVFLGACASKPSAVLVDNDQKSVHRNVVEMDLLTGQVIAESNHNATN